MRLPSELGAALPHLRHLTVAGYRNGGHGLEGLLSCRGLRSLALVGVYCSALPGLGPLSRLGRLEALSLRGCDQLTDLPLGSRLASLTSLEVRACPALFSLAGQQPAAAAQHAALINFVEWAAGRLPGLGELSNLESLDLSRSSTLRRLPAGVARLSRLTRLAADGCRLDDCEGAAAGGALAPLLGCGALEALSLRGVTGVPAEAALPAGIGNLSRLQVLDIGGSSRFAPLPESVATLPALRSIVLPRGMTGPGSPHSHVLARLQARGGGGADGGAPGLVVLTEG
ncbi:hypothetical protein MNEG_9912 [Monoraphidium neglectum]|uniref:Uncharacterized protein n=1 Tax=Monoraphidium neglectum TaxID=145388 RepID=A0A0D2M390_9CHLO|nr:hypothetical protein MNEG_9912 [Monoraphidium neglectum]KIY98049.1 hypothetical protein MNEG_9912 [Monoraphidium neglectum]|eukprot:XP_013897069.1 hypothetical protein MNEG_9912 [Monoraphidium neglectum]